MRCLFTALLLFCFGASEAQVSLDSAMLRYHCTRRSVNRKGDSVLLRSRVNIAFSPGWIRVEQSQRPGVWTFMLGDRKGKRATAYVNNTEEFYRFDEEYSNELFRLGQWNAAELQATLLPDTATIRGRACRKALLRGTVAGTPEAMELWYLPDTLLRATDLKSIFAAIPGVPVRFRFADHPTITIGEPHEATIEYNLFELEAPPAASPGVLAEAGRYQPLDESARVKTLMRLMMARKKED